MFCIYTDKRITFSEIRQHPVFKKYFPKASQASELLYQNKYQSTRLKRNKGSFLANDLVKKKSRILSKVSMSGGMSDLSSE